jgi:cysteinyl-tRNA synthetase
MVTLTNTLSGKKETFRSLQPDRVTLYACGITPYDRAHIGHARSYVSFDLLYRWLIFLGYDVTY